MKCVCGHWHAATCPHCGCSIPEPDDGTDGRVDNSCYGPNRLIGANQYHHPADEQDDL
jgi:hypothetical protein